MAESDQLRHWRQLGRSHLHRGHRIFYRHDGTGPALLCIHGFPTASWDWHKVWRALTERFRVVAPDMIGFGFSAKPRRYDYSIFDQADLVEGLLAELDVSSFDILAHDYGDTVAQELLARQQEREAEDPGGSQIRSVCFLNGGLIPDANRPRPIQKLLLTPLAGWLAARLIGEGQFRRSFQAIFAPGRQPTDQEMSQFWRLVSREGGIKVVHRIIRYLKERDRHEARWVGALARPSVPLRLIDGALDPVSGRRMAERYREVVPRPDVVVLGDVGHYPQLEAPRRVVRAFFEFIESRD